MPGSEVITNLTAGIMGCLKSQTVKPLHLCHLLFYLVRLMQDVAIHLHKDELSTLFTHLAFSIEQEKDGVFGSDDYSANLALKYSQKLNIRHPGLVDSRLITIMSTICDTSNKNRT